MTGSRVNKYFVTFHTVHHLDWSICRVVRIGVEASATKTFMEIVVQHLLQAGGGAVVVEAPQFFFPIQREISVDFPKRTHQHFYEGEQGRSSQGLRKQPLGKFPEVYVILSHIL